MNIVAALPATDAPTALVGEPRLMLHIEVDAAAARQRIGKELAGSETERGGLSARLANEQFVAKAPPQVVEQARARLASLQATIEQLQAQLKRLSG